ncbi:hypothetical protein [Ruegeria arenilitoris]|uniref:hypothetical protein n=1 Tax=Ruegeria arenilitoris TaxID=1173585 RepID=UPI0014817B08|nr:hypothetical protein [Ruegeria arenilitoris]
MSIEKVLAAAIEAVPGCLAAGYIDMETGMLLGTSAIEQDNASSLKSSALAATNLFQGSGIAAFEKLLRSDEADQTIISVFGEVAVFSDDRVFIFLRMQELSDHVIFFICQDRTNIELMLAKSHLSLGPVAAAI